MEKIYEKNVTRAILKYLNSLPDCHCQKRKAGPGRKGEADITGCYKGRRIEIEVKVGSNKPTALQVKQLEKWGNVGAITGVALSVEDVTRIMTVSQASKKKPRRSRSECLSKLKELGRCGECSWYKLCDIAEIAKKTEKKK